jgi:hypothetical protein
MERPMRKSSTSVSPLVVFSTLFILASLVFIYIYTQGDLSKLGNLDFRSRASWGCRQQCIQTTCNAFSGEKKVRCINQCVATCTSTPTPRPTIIELTGVCSGIGNCPTYPIASSCRNAGCTWTPFAGTTTQPIGTPFREPTRRICTDNCGGNFETE